MSIEQNILNNISYYFGIINFTSYLLIKVGSIAPLLETYQINKINFLIFANHDYNLSTFVQIKLIL